MPEFAYRYSARNARNQDVRGVIFAANVDMAYARIKQSAMRAQSVSFSLGATVTRWLSGGEMPRKELVRFYRVLARRYRSGRPVIDALESASSFVRDDALLQGAVMMSQRMLDGSPIHEAMKAAGFPHIHAMSIRASEGSGNLGEAFSRLADELERDTRLSKGIAAAMRTPKLLGGIMYAALFLSTYFLAPMPEEFMREMGKRPEPMHQMYFAASHALHDNLMLWGLIYLALPISVVMMGRRVRLARVLDYWPAWRKMSERADQGTCWTAFAMLYQAGIPPFECAKVVAGAARRSDTSLAFLRFGDLLTSGQTISVSVARASFPGFVMDGVSAAEESGGSLAASLQEFTRELAEDVEEATLGVQANMQVISILLGGTMLIVFAYLTLFPILAASVPG